MKRLIHTYYVWDFSTFGQEGERPMVLDQPMVGDKLGDYQLRINGVRFVGGHHLTLRLDIQYKSAVGDLWLLVTESTHHARKLVDSWVMQAASSKWIFRKEGRVNVLGEMEYTLYPPRNIQQHKVVLQFFTELAAQCGRPNLLAEAYLYLDVYQKTDVPYRHSVDGDPSYRPYSEHIIREFLGKSANENVL
jgi:hypothetical protein